MDYRNFHEELHAYEMKARKLRSEEFRRMVFGLFSPFKRYSKVCDKSVISYERLLLFYLELNLRVPVR